MRAKVKGYLTTTDHASHLNFVLDDNYGITLSHIDEKKELEKYKEEVLSKARETRNEEDLPRCIPESVKKLLPKLKDAYETEGIIVTLGEATLVYEAMRLEDDLKRAGINNKWRGINSSIFATNTSNKILQVKSNNGIPWINKVNEISNGNLVVVECKPEEVKGEKLLELIK